MPPPFQTRDVRNSNTNYLSSPPAHFIVAFRAFQVVKELFVFRSGVCTVVKTIDVAHPGNDTVSNPMAASLNQHNELERLELIRGCAKTGDHRPSGDRRPAAA